MVSRWSPVAVVVAAFVVAPADGLARSVRDPDIGWPAARLRALDLTRIDPAPCREAATKRTKAIVDRIDRTNVTEGLRAIFAFKWGNLWFDHCDGGRLSVGVPAQPQTGLSDRLRRSRRLVRRRGLDELVRFIAVRSTYKQLLEAQDALNAAFTDLFDAGQMTSGLDPSRNAITVEIARTTPAARERDLRAAALASPVNVVVHRIEQDDLYATPQSTDGAAR